MEVYAKQIDNLKRKVEATYSPFSKLKGLLAAVGVFAVGYYLTGIVSARIETLHLARQIGETVHSIDILASSLRAVGQDGSIAADVLGELSKTIAAAASGNAAMADVFARIGLDIAKLNAMKPSEAFWIIAKQISAIADAEVRAAVASQIFGSNATKVLGVLYQGARAADEAGKRIDRFGRAASDIEIAQLEAAAIKFEEIKVAIEAAGIVLITKLAPYILEVAKNIEGWTSNAQGAYSAFARVGRIIGYIYIIANDTWQAIKLVGLSIAAGFLLAVKLYLSVVDYLQKKVIQLLEIAAKLHLPFAKSRLEMVKNAGSGVAESWVKGIDETLQNMKGVGNDILMNKWIDLDSMDNSLNNIENSAKATGKALDNTARAGGSVAAAFKNNPLFQKGLQVINDNITPMQKFNSEMKELDAMLRMGAIGWETYGRASIKALSALENAYNMHNISLPNALKLGSGADVSAINKSRMEFETRRQESPMERMRRVQEQALAVEKQQLQVAEDMARAARDRKIYDIK